MISLWRNIKLYCKRSDCLVGRAYPACPLRMTEHGGSLDSEPPEETAATQTRVLTMDTVG